MNLDNKMTNEQSAIRNPQSAIKRVLILCTGNSARSQMAEGLLRAIGGDKFEVFSAGTHPSIVRPEAIAVMKEKGIDISHHRSKSVDEFIGQHFDYVITVCDNAKENCPVFPAKTNQIHHNFADPAAVEGDDETRLNAFRIVRDEIERWLKIWSAVA
jgi:arsenate reductase